MLTATPIDILELEVSCEDASQTSCKFPSWSWSELRKCVPNSQGINAILPVLTGKARLLNLTGFKKPERLYLNPGDAHLGRYDGLVPVERVNLSTTRRT